MSHSPSHTIHRHLSSRELSYMRTDVPVALCVDVVDPQVLPNLLASIDQPVVPLGSGSNVLMLDAIAQPLLRIRHQAIQCVEAASQSPQVKVRVGAGLSWNALIDYALTQGWHGLENLALIPGTCGAAPVQNIGAYGVEVAEYIDHIRAYDQHTHTWHELPRDACDFAYRDSLFKQQPDRYLITDVCFRFDRTFRPILGYPGVDAALQTLGCDVEQPDTIQARDMVQAIRQLRRSKLPDPTTTPNLGSFFKNPIISSKQAQSFKQQHATMPVYAVDDAHDKLSAAWLIDQCGLKGHRVGDAGVSEQHALILINHGDASAQDFRQLIAHIQNCVQTRFDVTLEPEPRQLPDA